MTVPFTHIDRLYIDGSWAAPQAGHEAVLNPATGAVIGEAPQASLAQIDAAIAAAREAFDKGPWPALSMDQRADMMQRMHDALRARQAEIDAAARLKRRFLIDFTGGNLAYFLPDPSKVEVVASAPADGVAEVTVVVPGLQRVRPSRSRFGWVSRSEILSPAVRVTA